ncbi:hypothetical protein FQN57_000627 [Myotisia sp. PD_48]|nr:hypothetical protein FQN57_000627 [Myotisia sp. PD_48]
MTAFAGWRRNPRLKTLFTFTLPRPNCLTRYDIGYRLYSKPSSPPPESRIRARIQALNNVLPRFLRIYTTPLVNAPIKHITSFLILHEITAIVPLFVLAGVFHYGGWLPSLGGDEGSTINEGVRRFGKWFKKRGWVNEDAEAELSAELAESISTEHADGMVLQLNSNSNRGVRLVLEFATAYAITKLLLPIRIMASVWATPWFARTVLGPVGRTFSRLTKKGDLNGKA